MYDQAAGQVRTISIVNIILGFWLMIAPYIFGTVGTESFWNATWVGLAIVIFGFVRLIAPSQTWASWGNALAGLWLIVSPFILGFESNAAYWNQLILGVIVATLAFMNLGGERSHTGHGRPV